MLFLAYLWWPRDKIRQGQRWLTQAMKETILQIPEPKTPRQVREFLGTVGYCRLWIMGFAKKARPLYEKSKETPNWTWTEPMKQAFQTLRRALLEAPALALPNPNKPFQLFVDEKQKNKKGGLDATMGTMEVARDIPFKVIRPGGLWVAPLPPHHCSHCPPRPRCRQVDV